jgi:hypothetical protein
LVRGAQHPRLGSNGGARDFCKNPCFSLEVTKPVV